MEKIRINQLLAARLGISRRTADFWIQKKRVLVNGKEAQLGQKVDVEKDIIIVDQKPLPPQKQILTFAFHKPKGVVCSLSPKFEKGISITKFFPPNLGLKPAGRLDTDSEGLIIISNDGNLIYEITHPSREVEKEYIVTTKQTILDKDMSLLSKGVFLTDGFCKPDRLIRLGSNQVKLVIHEGRNREVRRLFAAINHEVVRLIRVRIGPIELGDLPVGALRALTDIEKLQLLKR